MIIVLDNKVNVPRKTGIFSVFFYIIFFIKTDGVDQRGHRALKTSIMINFMINY